MGFRMFPVARWHSKGEETVVDRTGVGVRAMTSQGPEPTRVPHVRFWRWRANPLRRRSDVVEAWIVLLTDVLMTVGAVVVGVLAFFQVDHTAQLQAGQRHPVQAVVRQDAHHPAASALYVSPSGDRARVPVSWQAPDGTPRNGSAVVRDGVKAGQQIRIWVDAHGNLTEKPSSPVMVGVQSAMAGGLAAGGFCALVLTGRHLTLARLNRRRAAEWDRGLAELGLGHGPRTP
jgi:hypothetical protein